MKRQAISKNLNLKLALITLILGLTTGANLWCPAAILPEKINILTKREKEIIALIIAEGPASQAARTYLLGAAETGAIGLVAAILDIGVDVNSQNDNRETALMHAAANGSISATAFLLAKGANPNIQENINGDTALLLVLFKGHGEIANLLINHDSNNVNLVNNDGIAPLMIAAAKNQIDVVKLLLVKGASPNLKITVNGNTALILALSEGHDEIVSLLINHANTDVNLATNKGATPLMMAVIENRIAAVQLLLAKKANPNSQGITYGKTALLLAIDNNNVEIVRLLLSCDNIDLYVKNKAGEDAMARIEIFLVNCRVGGFIGEEQAKMLQIQALFHSKLMAVEAAAAECQRAAMLAQLSLAMADSDRTDDCGAGASESKEN